MTSVQSADGVITIFLHDKPADGCHACRNRYLPGSVHRIKRKRILSYIEGMICNKRQVLDSTPES